MFYVIVGSCLLMCKQLSASLQATASKSVSSCLQSDGTASLAHEDGLLGLHQWYVKMVAKADVGVCHPIYE